MLIENKQQVYKYPIIINRKYADINKLILDVVEDIKEPNRLIIDLKTDMMRVCTFWGLPCRDNKRFMILRRSNEELFELHWEDDEEKIIKSVSTEEMIKIIESKL